MPYWKERNLLFIHIPKTGGTIIEGSIPPDENGVQWTHLYSGPTNPLLDFPYNQKSLQHQFYTTIYKFRDKLDVNFDNIKIFSIVRNPYDRIISDLFNFKLITKDFTAEQVYNVIKNNYLFRDDLDNHNEPQYKFIVDENSELIKNIKIFRTETLNESSDEMSKFVGVSINLRREGVNKDYSNYLNKDSISLINSFYKKDFELFNYKLKSEPGDKSLLSAGLLRQFIQ